MSFRLYRLPGIESIFHSRLALGWGESYEDHCENAIPASRNEVILGLTAFPWQWEFVSLKRTIWDNLKLIFQGLKRVLTPRAMSAWKDKEIAHETDYSWLFLTVTVQIPKLDGIKCSLLEQ